MGLNLHGNNLDPYMTTKEQSLSGLDNTSADDKAFDFSRSIIESIG